MLGPSLLCRIKKVRDLFDQRDFSDYTVIVSFVFRILFMFMIGLETDIPYMKRNFRQASVIACGGLIACSAFGAAITIFVIRMLIIKEHEFIFFLN